MKLKPGWFLFAAVLATATIVLTAKIRRQRAEFHGLATASMPALDSAAPDHTVARLSAPAPVREALPISAPSSTVAPTADTEPVVASSANPVQLVAELQKIGPEAPGVPITAEQADKFKQNVAELVRQG